jgi:hypothetical protein
MNNMQAAVSVLWITASPVIIATPGARAQDYTFTRKNALIGNIVARYITHTVVEWGDGVLWKIQ